MGDEGGVPNPRSRWGTPSRWVEVTHPRSRWGGYPISDPGGGTQSEVCGGTPFQVQVEVSHPDGGGFTIPGPGGGTPYQVWGVPHPAGGMGTHPMSRQGDTISSWWWRVPHPRSRLGVGVPHLRSGWGTTIRRQQHSKHLLYSGKYASCIHAGGHSYEQT